MTIAAEGGKADNAEPMKGTGSGVFEIVLPHKSNAFRVVYAVQLGDDIWVVHAIQKKSMRGIKTPKREPRRANLNQPTPPPFRESVRIGEQNLYSRAKELTIPNAVRIAELVVDKTGTESADAVTARRQLNDLPDDLWTRISIECYRCGIQIAGGVMRR